MQKVIKLWFAFTLSAGLLASCSQDGREPSVATDGGGETVTLSLSAEVSVEDPSLRALEHKLGTNKNGAVVPMPQFVDKEEVEVHTIIKSSTGARVAKTLKWVYDAEKRKLVLAPTNRDISLDANNMVIANFNNDGGVKWYISGLIGGVLSGTKVEFMGSRVVKGVDGTAGDALGSMNVPYAFGWTELTIDTQDRANTRESNNSYKYAKVPTATMVKFRPLGSLLAVKLGNASAYSLTAKGFTLSSNAWGDQGSFELNTAIPGTEPEKQLPIWQESSCIGSMYYTFASGYSPDVIGAGAVLGKKHYVWVMPHATQPITSAEVRVMLKGESSSPATDYTKTYFTDYSINNTTQGKVTQGLVHSLTAKATRRVTIPIEYVTDYNLAGGEGLTYTTTNYTSSQPVGVRGPLRFSNYDDNGTELPAADRHKNNASGYYNWYKVVGREDATYNPETKNLQTAVDATFGVGKYFIPTQEQWWGVFPSAQTWSQAWSGASERSNTTELMGVSVNSDVLRQAYLSDYSASFTSPHGGDNNTGNAVFYAIRFKARTNVCAPVSEAWDYDATSSTIQSYTYPSAPDNSMKCAYRFTRVGGRTSWVQQDNQNLTNHLKIDVVYLGEEASPTSLSAISDESWWSAKISQGQVISKVFPATGTVYGSSSASGRLSERGYWGSYWSSNQHHASYAWRVGVRGLNVRADNTWNLPYGLAVRLFVRRDQ